MHIINPINLLSVIQPVKMVSFKAPAYAAILMCILWLIVSAICISYPVNAHEGWLHLLDPGCGQVDNDAKKWVVQGYCLTEPQIPFPLQCPELDSVGPDELEVVIRKLFPLTDKIEITEDTKPYRSVSDLKRCDENGCSPYLWQL